MKIRFNMSATIPGSKSFDKGSVYESSDVPGGYLKSWLASGICEPHNEQQKPAEKTPEKVD